MIGVIRRAPLQRGRFALLLGGLVLVVACGGSDKVPGPILGNRVEDPTPGLRRLTASQTRALQRVITSAGEPCAALEQAYLRDAEPELGNESWDVRCADGAYSVRIAAGTPNTVRPCIARSRREEPCFDSYSRGRRFGGRRASPPLNPELGELLGPMTSKTEKAD